MKNSLNVKLFKKCAFCKYWYDPCNTHIAPKTPSKNIWEYEVNTRCKCLKKNVQMAAFSSCSNYECKITII